MHTGFWPFKAGNYVILGGESWDLRLCFNHASHVPSLVFYPMEAQLAMGLC